MGVGAGSTKLAGPSPPPTSSVLLSFVYLIVIGGLIDLKGGRNTLISGSVAEHRTHMSEVLGSVPCSAYTKPILWFLFHKVNNLFLK